MELIMFVNEVVSLLYNLTILGLFSGGAYYIFYTLYVVYNLLQKDTFRDPRLPPFKKIYTQTGELLEGPDIMLGSGSYGIVTRFKLNGTHVAVKLPKKLTDNNIQQHEITLLKAANPHPNILKYITSVTLDRKICLVTEYMQGSVRDLLNNNPKLSWNTKLSVAIQLAKGVAHLHNLASSFFNQEAIIHQDLKSSNLLVNQLKDDPDIHVKIGDFGVALQVEQTHLPLIGDIYLNVINGKRGWTDIYSAPEIYNGGKIAIKSDVFSMGIILCEIATNKIPYRSYREISDGLYNEFEFDKISNRKRIIQPSFFGIVNTLSIQPTYPKYSIFGPIIDKCLKPIPNDRYSAEEVLQHLQKLTLI